MMQETYRHGFICEDYVTVIFMYTISTVHNPDRQNYIQKVGLRFSKIRNQYDVTALVLEEHEPVRI